MENLLRSCRLCPRKCGIDRLSGDTGFCGADDRIKIARAALHFWEEPCISGDSGSGTVFFSHCTLKCAYCQNYSISTENNGKYVTEKELAEIFLDRQNQGANNINLVTPTHYVPQIIAAIDIARKHGLSLPILYNTSGYETPETIRLLKGYVDIYLPDFKYFDDTYAKKYSAAPDYCASAKAAIREMFHQAGKCEFDENGIIQKGVIVRHLMLPGGFDDSKKIIEYLFRKYGDDIFISIMSQYTPLSTIPEKFPELKKPIAMEDYDKLLDYAINLGVENAFIQEGESQSESFIPEFYWDKD